MRYGAFSATVIGVLGIAVSGSAEKAFAEEGIFPYLPGATIGVPAGALPAPGLYVDEKFFVFNYVLHDGSGNSTPVKIRELDEDTTILWVPGVKIFGADYGAFFVQPYREATSTQVPIYGKTSTGDFINLVISPLNLSWNLGGGWHVSTGFTYYPSTYSWKSAPSFLPAGAQLAFTDSINAGRNYDTFEPSFAVSYLAAGWNLTAHAVIDFNDTNPANNYHSGTVFLMDYTATKKLGEFDVGLGGTVIQQLENDTQNGAVVPAGSLPGGAPVSSRGNVASALSIGPSIGYEWNKVHFTLQWMDWVEAKNTAGGNQTWFRVHVPVSAMTTALEQPLK